MYKCPKCKSEEIEIVIEATVFQDPEGNLLMEEFRKGLIQQHSLAYCAAIRCGWSGEVKNLEK